MNIWNVALLARVFIFFAYPTTISGDQVWVSGYDGLAAGTAADYGWAHNLFNSIFSVFGWDTFDAARTAVVDGFTGATPLALAYEGGWEKVTTVYTSAQMMWGSIPGSIGETAKPLIIVGALFLIFTKVASWRIMVSMFLGAIAGSFLMNWFGASPFSQVTWSQHMLMGSFLFAMAFMATDPVTASSTNTGKWIYGFLIGIIGIIIRVTNAAYPEGWMLAILFLNTFSPLIDHYVLEGNIKKRLASA
jgi:Na+-transporting NADH:ubiquinone oxidoreductase subunit B